MDSHASMNRLYRVVWNESLNTWVAVSEIAKGRCKSSSGRKRLLALAAVSGFLQPFAMAGPLDGVVTDGRTQTTVNVSGNQASIETATVRGTNAFNSFSSFDVRAGETANLHVPTGANNLINMVSGGASQIFGVVNAYKGGAIGGNVWFANSSGIVIGSTGVFNVGSLHLTTPSAQFISNFFSNGSPHAPSVDQLLTGQAPLSVGGVIRVDGLVNAPQGVSLVAGKVTVGGQIYSQATPTIGADTVVNLDGGSGTDTAMVLENGRVRIVAVDPQAEVWLSGATIEGRSLLLTADATAGNNSVLLGQADAHAAINIANSHIDVAEDIEAHASSQVSLNTFGLLPTVVSVQLADASAAVSVTGTSALIAGGNVALSALTEVEVEARPTSFLSDQAGDAGVAVSKVDSLASVVVADNSSVQAVGDVALSAENLVKSVAVADASAEGNTAAGATVAVSVVNATTQVLVKDQATLQADSVSLQATSEQVIEVSAKAAAQGAKKDESGDSESSKQLAEHEELTATEDGNGGVTVAGAVAVNTLTATTRAEITSGAVDAVIAAGGVEVSSQSSAQVDVKADGSTAEGGTGVAAAVAVNVSDITQQALVNGEAVAANLNVSAGSDTAKWVDVAGQHHVTEAIAGAGAEDVGVAGAVAVNVIDHEATAALQAQAQVTLAGGVARIDAEQISSVLAKAVPAEGGVTGSSVGVGASVAVNVVANRADALVNMGAVVQGSGDVLLSARGEHELATEAEAGAAGGIAVTPALALTIGSNRTSAQVAQGAAIDVDGSVALHADQLASADTKVTGQAEGDKVAVGASIGVAVVNDEVVARLAGAVTAGGDVDVAAHGASSSRIESVAGARGAKAEEESSGSSGGASSGGDGIDQKISQKLGFGSKVQQDKGVGDQSQRDATQADVQDQKNGKASASTSEGQVSVAAAVAVNVQKAVAKAEVTGTAVVNALGETRLEATHNTDAIIDADGRVAAAEEGEESNADIGVGAAVAVNAVTTRADATVHNGAVVNTEGLSVRAGMTELDHGDDVAHQFDASASSGAGASNVGVSGALALNIIDAQSQAKVAAGSNVNAGGGDVFVGAESMSSASAVAAPKEEMTTTGEKVGVGASVAVSVIATRTQAEIEAGAHLVGGRDIAVQADATHEINTRAKAGSAGGISITPVAAIAVVNNNTEAKIGDHATGLSNTGGVQVGTTHFVQTKTEAEGSSEGGKAAVGAAVAVTVISDVAHAVLQRDVLNAGGDVEVITEGHVSHQSLSKASAAGGKSDSEAGGSEDATVDDKVQKQEAYGLEQQRTNKVGSSDQQNASSSAAGQEKSASTDEGKVSVAAAVSVNVVDAEFKAEIADGVSVRSAGHVNVGAFGQTDALAQSSGETVGEQSKVGVAAAVSVNVANSKTHARVGSSDVEATGVNVTSGMTSVPTETIPDAQHDISAMATSGAGGSNVGVAGSLALNIGHTRNVAELATGALIDAGAGLVEVVALEQAVYTAHALPVTDGGATGGKVGVGVSAALNIVNAGAEAVVQDDAEVVASGGVLVEATSALDTETKAAAGSQGGKMAFDAAVAVTTLNQTAVARVGAGNTLTSTGNVVIDALSSGVHAAEAKGEASAGNVAVGASVALIVSSSQTNALLERDASAESLAVIADSQRAFTSEATATAGGSQSQETYDENKGQADKAASSKALKDNQNGETNQGTQGGGAVAIAAAVGITVLNDDAKAEIRSSTSGPRDVALTGGDLTVEANSDTNFSARGVGDSFNSKNKVGVGVGVGIAVVNNHTNAGIGGGAQVDGADDVTVSATSSQNRGADFKDKLAAEGIAGASGSQVGVAGGFAVAVTKAQTAATLGAGTHVRASGDIDVFASQENRLAAKAWAGAKGGSVGVGATVATVVSSGKVQALVGDGADIEANSLEVSAENKKVNDGGFNFAIGSIDEAKALPDNLTHGALLGAGNYYVEALSGAFSDKVGVSGAVALAITQDTIQSEIGEGAQVKLLGGDLAVTSDSDTVSKALAGAAAYGGQVGVGVSAAVLKHSNQTTAEIADGVTVSDARDVLVSASNKQDVDSIGISGGVGGTVGVSGVANVLLQENTTRALVGSQANIGATRDVTVDANNVFDSLSVTGGIGIGGTVGVGVAAAVNTLNNTTEAAIGSQAQVQAAGLTSVHAESSDEMDSFAVGAAGGGTVAVGGAVLVNVVNTSTSASIGASADINQSVGGLTQGVEVAASADTRLFEVVAGAGGGGTVGGGAASDVTLIDKDVNALIGAGAQVRAGGDIAVTADSTESLRSNTVGAGVGGVAGVAGSVAVYSVAVETHALISQNALAHANNNLVVDAQAATDMNMITGAVAASGVAAVGAGIGVIDLSKDTQASVGAGANVSALGLGSDTYAATGEYVISYGGNLTGDSVVSGSNVQAKDAEGNDVSHDSLKALTKTRNAQRQVTATRGVVVSATNADSVKSFALTGAASGVAAVAIGSATTVLTTNTEAAIGANALVNQVAGANAAQGVVVAAGNDQFHMGLAGGAAGAGGVGVGAAADVFIADNTVVASIGANSNVDAAGSVNVLANAHQQALVSGMGLAGAGMVGVAGSVSTFVTENQTHAVIGASTDVDAGGNVKVAAEDDTVVDLITGAAAVGWAGGGAAGAVDVASIQKSTTASIGEGAQVDALANRGTHAVLRGDQTGATQQVKGVAVQADSSESLFATTVSGAGGTFAGLSGASSAAVVSSDTIAQIGSQAQINQASGANAAQGVHVVAQNHYDSTVIVGSAAFGAVSLSGAVDVGALRHNTQAVIGSGAGVKAAGDIEVKAVQSTDIQSVVISGSVGLAGVAGGVSVYSVGQAMAADGQSEISNDKGSVSDDVDAQVGNSAGNDLLASSSDSRVSGVAAGVQARRDGAQVGAKLAGGSANGTQALVGAGADLKAGQDIAVKADTKLEFDALAGAAAAGLVGIGAGVSVSDFAMNTQATLGSGVKLEAGRDIAIKANLNESASADAWAGSAALGIGLNAAAAITRDASVVQALVGSGAQITQARHVVLDAQDVRDLQARAGGVSVGYTGAAGASVAHVDIGGSTSAVLSSGALVGQDASGSVSSLTVNADADLSGDAEARAVTGGVGAALSGADARSNVKPTVQARIDAGQIKTTGAVKVDAGALSHAGAESMGVSVAGGLAAGASLANAKVMANVQAGVASNTTVTAGSLSVNATHGARTGGTNAQAKATGTSAAFLVGVNATQANAETSGTVKSSVGENVYLNVTGAVNVLADQDARQVAEVSGKAGGLVALGANKALAKSNTQTDASVGAGTVVRGAQPTSLAGSLTVNATGEDNNYAEAISGAGGVVAGSAAEASTQATSVTVARVADSATIQAKQLNVVADHMTRYNTMVDAMSAAVVGKSGAKTTNTVTSTVNALLGTATNTGAGVQVLGNGVNVAANNRSSKTWLGGDGWNIDSGSGGALDLPASTSLTSVNHFTNATLGRNADVHLMPSAGINASFSLDAYNSVVSQDTLRMASAGLISLADVRSVIDVDARATATVAKDAEVLNDLGDIRIGSHSDVVVDARANGKATGAAGAPSGTAYALVDVTNNMVLSEGAALEASYGSVALGAGYGANGSNSTVKANSDVYLYNKTAVPIVTLPDAATDVNTTSDLTMATGSTVRADDEVRLYASKGVIDASATGIGKDLYRETLAAIGSFVSNLVGGGDLSLDIVNSRVEQTGAATVRVDGEVLAGINRQRSISFDLEITGVDADGNKTWRVNGVTADGITYNVQENVEVAQKMNERISYLTNLMEQYVGTPAADAYAQEIKFLEAKMVEMGLAGELVLADGSKMVVGSQAGLSDYELAKQDLARSLLRIEADVLKASTDASAVVTSLNGLSVQTKVSSLANYVLGLVSSSGTPIGTLAGIKSALETAKTELAAASKPTTDIDTFLSTLTSQAASLNSSRGTLAANASSISAKQAEITQLNNALAYMKTVEPSQFASSNTAITALGLSGCGTYNACAKTVATALSARASELDTLVASSKSLTTSVTDALTTLKNQYAAVLTGLPGDVTLTNATTLSGYNNGSLLSGATGLNVDTALASFQTQTQTAGASKVLASSSNLRDTVVGYETESASLSSKSTAKPKGITTAAITVDDIVARLGRIEVQGDVLTGQGALRAPGDALIHVVNNTPGLLTLGKLTVDSENRGMVLFNGAMLGSPEQLTPTRPNPSGVDLSRLTIQNMENTPQAQILVESKYNPDSAFAAVRGPAPDITLSGDISNPHGSVTVRSESGSIYSNAAVQAASVSILAKNGDFVQSYVDNFYHVSGSPEENAATGAGGGTGIVANGSVVVSARYLNINGLIQSGIADWNLNLNANTKAVGKVTDFGFSAGTFSAAKTAYDQSPSTAQRYTTATWSGHTFTYDAQLNQVSTTLTAAKAASARTGASKTFVVTESGSNIGASYNTLADRIELDATMVRGGYIQLYGQIMNTANNGAGKLSVLDGFGQININNTLGLSVVLNSIDTGLDKAGDGRGVKGVIDITDIRVDSSGRMSSTQTVITREDGLITTTTSRNGRATNTHSVSNAGNRTATLNLLDNDRYVWVTGQDFSEYTYWTYKGTQFFGSDSLRTKPTGTAESHEGPFALGRPMILENGRYVTKSSSSNHLVATTDNYTLSDDWVKTGQKSNCNWWTLCIAQNYTMYYTQTVGTKEVVTNSMKATYPIAINFIGQDAGRVNVNSVGSVVVAGNIANASGTTSITSTAGTITADAGNKGLVGGKTVNLAAKSVGEFSQALAVRTQGGVLNATASDGNVVVRNALGSVNVGNISATGSTLSEKGRVILSSDGDITGSATSLIRGERVELAATNGSITASGGEALRIEAGYTDNLAQRPAYGVKAQAAGDIKLSSVAWSGNVNGDLLVDRIDSRNGDVLVRSVGRILDNNPIETADTRTESELLAYWDNMGLVEGSVQNIADQAAAIDAFELSETQAYRDYWRVRNRLAETGASAFTLTAAEVTALQQGGLDGAGIAAYEAEMTARYASLSDKFASAGGTYDEAYRYVASGDERGALLRNASWTKKELSLSIGAGLLKEVTSTNTVVKAANVSGRNVTLDAGVAIGETQVGIVIPDNVDVSCQVGVNCLTREMRLALAAAERNDLVLSGNQLTVLARKPVNFDASNSLSVNVAGTQPLSGSSVDVGAAYVASQGNALISSFTASGDARIKVKGSIVNTQGGSAIAAGNLILEAADGSIGARDESDDDTDNAPDGALRLALHNGATVIARSQQGVNLDADGDLNVDTVYSRAGVRLNATGNILDHFGPAALMDDADVDVMGTTVAMTAGGNIGVAGNAIEVRTGTGKQVTATAGGDVHLHGVRDEQMNVGNVTAGGDVSLVGDHDITVQGTVDVAGTAAVSSGADVNIVDGSLLHAGGQIAIVAGGDASLTGIVSEADQADAVRIDVQGNLLDAGDTRADIVANAAPDSGVVLNVGGSVGAGNAIEVAANHFAATVGGGFAVNLDGDAVISAISSGDDIEIVANGSLVATTLSSSAGSVDVHTSGDLSVTNTDAAQDVSFVSDNAAVTAGTLSAGDDAVFAAATTVDAGTITAQSVVASATTGITVDSMNVGSSFSLAANQVAANIQATSPSITGAVAGAAGGRANEVDLTIATPGTVIMSSLVSQTADVHVSSGQLDIAALDVSQHGVFSTAGMQVVLQPTTWTLDPTADVQLYSGGQPITLSLYDNHVNTDASVPYRGPNFDAVSPTGRNLSLLENGLLQMGIAGHGLSFWLPVTPEAQARRLEDEPPAVNFTGMQLSMKDN